MDAEHGVSLGGGSQECGEGRTGDGRPSIVVPDMVQAVVGGGSGSAEMVNPLQEGEHRAGGRMAGAAHEEYFAFVPIFLIVEG